MPQVNPCVEVTDEQGHNRIPPTIYTANLDTTLTYAIDFEFLAQADVVVYREQPEGTFTLLTNSAATGATPPNYTINEGVDPSVVTFANGEAPGGVRLIIGRRTNICEPLVEYQVGASIRAQDMNLSNDQLLFLIQETRSILGFLINGNDDDPIIPGTGMDLNDLDDVNVGDPVNPDPAVLRFNGTEWVGNAVQLSNFADNPWQSNNTTFATTAAGDERWLNAVGGDLIGGPGIETTEAAATVTVGVDLAGTSGLEFTEAGNDGELRIDANNGCEIVADGLNAETTAASIVQTGGTNVDPAIRIATTLGDTTTNTDLQITGGNNVTVTRTDDNNLTIAATGGGGGDADGVEIVANVAALNALVDLNADPVVEPDDGTVILIQNSQGLAADSTQGDNNQDVNGLPETLANGSPIGGYSNQIQVTVQWDADDDEWDFVRWVPINMDNRYFNIDDGGNLQTCRSRGQQWNNGTRNLVSLTFDGDTNGPADFFIGTNGDNNTGTADFGIANLTNINANATRGVFITAGDNDDQFGRIDILGNEVGTLDVVFRVQTGDGTDVAKTNQISFFADGSADFEADVEVGSLRLQQEDDVFVTLTENGESDEAWTFVFPPTAPDQGTNWALVEREVGAGDQFTATMEWTQVATAAQLDGRVAVAGDTMTGNLQMDGASVIADNAETVPNNDGNWDIQSSNVWQVPNGRTIVFPDDSDAPIPGQTGIFVCAGTVAGWTNANGGTWEHPAGGANGGDAAGAIIPFYVQTTTNIILGTQTVGS